MDQVVSFGPGSGWGEWVVERAVQEVKQRMKGAKVRPEATFAETQTLLQAADDMKARYPSHCVTAAEAEAAAAQSMIPPDYDDGEGGWSGVVLLHKRRLHSDTPPDVVASVVDRLPGLLCNCRDELQAANMGWPCRCHEGVGSDADMLQRMTALIQEMHSKEHLELDFFRAASLSSQDVVRCHGTACQGKDDRWVYVCFPQEGQTGAFASSSSGSPYSVVKCVAAIKALVRVAVTGADRVIHPDLLMRHELDATSQTGSLLQVQPLRLALVDHWRAVACGKQAGYSVEANPVTGELPDLLHVADMSTRRCLQWTDKYSSDDSLSASGPRFYGELLCDVASISTQLVATRQVDTGKGRFGRYFMTAHKASGRQY